MLDTKIGSLEIKQETEKERRNFKKNVYCSVKVNTYIDIVTSLVLQINGEYCYDRKFSYSSEFH